MRPAPAALALVATAFCTLYTAQSAAQSAKDYPTRPIRLVIPQTAGSSTDTMSRVLAAKLSELLGQQLVVDNRTGAGGVIGAGIVANSEPDGYTLLCAATPSQVIGPQIYKSATKYEPLKAFTPIGQFAHLGLHRSRQRHPACSRHPAWLCVTTSASLQPTLAAFSHPRCEETDGPPTAGRPTLAHPGGGTNGDVIG